MTDANKQSNNRALSLYKIDRCTSHAYYDGWLEYFELTRGAVVLTATGSYDANNLNSFVDRSGLPQQEPT